MSKLEEFCSGAVFGGFLAALSDRLNSSLESPGRGWRLEHESTRGRGAAPERSKE